MLNRVIILLVVVMLAGCSANEQKKTKEGLVASKAIVVSAHPLASNVGLAILKRGGNAVDAAIATQLALAVVHPAAGNIGGGGFMVTRLNDGQVFSLDYREKAGAKASRDMYLGEAGEVNSEQSKSGHLASGVPGTVAGLAASHEKLGSLPWKELVQPAIELARNGFILTEKEAGGLNEIQEDLRTLNTVSPDAWLRSTWNPGDTIRNEDLAVTLELIRDLGAAGFYSGKTADNLVAEMNRGKGILTHQDLLDYKAVWRTPLVGTYKGLKVITMPPPSSGGVALLQLLRSVEPYPIAEWGHQTTKTVHLMVEAERRVYADRATHLGDPDFFNVPVARLTSQLYVDERMKSFNPLKATPSDSVLAGDISYETEQTTHLSVVDEKGNAVAVTTTLNGGYGSRVVVGGSGFLLNNEMDDFSVKPGVPNMFGAIGGEANKIEPGKRMLSSMTPTILEKDGNLLMVVGTPGGTTIITSVFQTILNVVEHGMTMQEAVEAKRFHHQWRPEEIFPEENAFDEETLTELKSMGHTIKPRRGIGRVDAILVRKEGGLEGGADPRGDDFAAGY